MTEWIRLPPRVRETLPNGLTIIACERRALPLVGVRIALRAGSSHDPAGSPGLSAFTARLLQHGAGALPDREFAEELDGIGGGIAPSIGLDQLTIDAETMSDSWERGRSLVLDALLRPRFDEPAVGRERDRAIAEIDQSRDDPEHVAHRAFQRFAYRAHPYGHPPEGTATSLAAMTPDRLRAWHGRALVPDGGAIVIVGDIDPREEVARWRDALSGWTSRGVPATPEDAPPAEPGVVLVHDEGSGQAQWRTGNVGLRRRTPHWFRIVAANAILGGGFTSRLVQEVRVERGLTYGIASRFVLGMAKGPFVISSFTKNATLLQMHEVAAGVLSSFRSGGATQDELDAAKAYVLGVHARRFETPEGLASALGDAEVYGLGEQSITGFRAGVEAVTLRDLNDALAELLPERLMTVVVGDAAQLEGACRAIGPVEIVQPDFAETMSP